MNKNEIMRNKDEVIDSKYVVDLECAKQMFSATKPRIKEPANVTGIIEYRIENASLDEIATKHAEIKRLFRKLLWNKKSNSDVIYGEIFFQDEVKK